MRIGAMLGDITRGLFSRPFTQLYPFERQPEPERLRGKLVFKAETCTGCKICSRDCPAEALEVVVIDKKAKRFALRFYVDRCTFCAQCKVSCKFDSIELASADWELAGLERCAFAECYGRPEDVAAAAAMESQHGGAAASNAS